MKTDIACLGKTPKQVVSEVFRVEEKNRVFPYKVKEREMSSIIPKPLICTIRKIVVPFAGRILQEKQVGRQQ